jgi:hypothetical protein
MADIIRAQQGYYAWGPEVYAGLSHDYRNLSDWLDQNLIPETAEQFWATETYCIDGNADVYTFVDTCNYFTRGCDGWGDPIPSEVLQTAGKRHHFGALRQTLIMFSRDGDAFYTYSSMVFVRGMIVLFDFLNEWRNSLNWL